MTENAKRAPRRARSRPDETTASVLDMAMRADSTGAAPGEAARALLKKHGRLIEADVRHRGWQIASERASFALKLLTGMVGVAAFVTVAVVLWSATQYRGLTVQPFSVPSELQARGLTGEVAAQRMLDRLAELQRTTDSARPANSFANSWGDDVSVTIPQTGVSVGELWRFLRAWLGEEVHITGEVVQTGADLQVVVRAGGHATPAVLAEDGDVEAALRRAAEALFAQTQPYRHAISRWTGSEGDEGFEQSAAALETLILTGDAMDRKWAFSGLVASLNALGRFDEALEHGRQGLAYAPDFAILRGNIAGAYMAMGQDEAALAELEEGARIGSRPGDYSPKYAELTSSLDGEALMKRRDLTRALVPLRRAADNGDMGTRLLLMQTHLAMRDVAAAREMHSFIPLADEAWPGVTGSDVFAVWTGAYLEDWEPALGICRTAEAHRPDMGPAGGRQYLTLLVPQCVETALASGALGEAEAMLADLPIRSPYLISAEAQVAAAQGDHARADRLFAEASRLAPSLPDADLAWGRARLARGDIEGGVERFREAARRAPRWADPLKLHADALMARDDHRGAIRLYRQAARHAPRWGGLHLAWGRALEATGDRRGALARYGQASDMDLSPADRAEIARRRG